jgi:flagellar basal-body rod protein FlgB
VYIGSQAAKLAAKALDFRSLRQDLISSNIANNMTPYYKARDINFQEYLRAEKRTKMDKDPDLKLELSLTNNQHMVPHYMHKKNSPEIYFRNTHMARNDANTVDLDIESTEMSKNSIMFNAITSALKKHSALIKIVIETSSKL